MPKLKGISKKAQDISYKQRPQRFDVIIFKNF